MAKTIDELKSAAAIVRDASEEHENTALRVGQLLIEMIDTLGKVQFNGIKGFVAISSVNDLPESPSREEQQKGYLLDTTLYVWTGTGGDTLDGKYRSVQLKGADGAPGAQGPKGDSGVSLGEIALSQERGHGEEAVMSQKAVDDALVDLDNIAKDSFSYEIPNNSKYLDKSGVETGYWDGACTDFISVGVGDVFYFTGKTIATFSNVCAYDANKVFLSVLYAGEGANTKIEIRTQGVAYIRVCALKSDANKSLTKDNLYSYGKMLTKLKDVAEKFVETVEDDVTEDIDQGHFINSSTSGYDANSSFLLKEYDVKAGTKITSVGHQHPNAAVFSKKLDNGKYEVLVATTKGFVEETHEYTATEDMTLVAGFYGISRARYVKIETDTLKSVDARIENIKQDLSDKKSQDKLSDICFGYLFDKVCAIGDSLSVGTLDAVSGLDGHAAGGSFGCSWLTCLSKRWGSSTRMHYGRGGATCYSWLGNNDYGLGFMLKDSIVYDAYFVALGHNDTGKYAIGTTADAAVDVQVDADNNVTFNPPTSDVTFLSMYKKIVNEIRKKAPNAIIFCMSTYDKDSVDGSIGGQNKYIKQLAEWYRSQGDNKVFFLDYAGKTDISRSTQGYGTNGHFSTMGYVYVAKVINECVNDVINEYKDTNALLVWGNYLESYRTTKIDTTKSGGYLEHL